MSKIEEYPRYLYGEKGDTVIVRSKDEQEALKGNYYASPAHVPATKEKAARAADVAPPAPLALVEDERTTMPVLKAGHLERDRLEAEAEHVGLKVDRRWSDETLRRQILEFASA